MEQVVLVSELLILIWIYRFNVYGAYSFNSFKAPSSPHIFLLPFFSLPQLITHQTKQKKKLQLFHTLQPKSAIFSRSPNHSIDFHLINSNVRRCYWLQNIKSFTYFYTISLTHPRYLSLSHSRNHTHWETSRW